MMTVDVRDLLDRPGSSRRISVSQELEGLETELARVTASRPVHIDVLLERVGEDIAASGSLHGRMDLDCGRCLKRFAQEFGVEIAERFARDEEEYPIGDGDIDLEPMVRDAILLAMPFSPLCRPDCRGLCDRCGGDRNLGECSCPPATDPRWAPLSDLRLD